MRTDAEHGSPPERSTGFSLVSRGAVAPLVFGVLLLVCCAVLAGWGSESQGERGAGLTNALVLIINGGLMAGAYVLAGIGLGRPFAWLLGRLPGVREADREAGPVWVQSCLGVAVLLWVSHLMGLMGLLSGPRGSWWAWGVVTVGLGLLADQVVRGPLRPERWPAMPVWGVLGAPGLAVLLIAACSPPGALWLGASSEGGGYDVMSYHLQLPKEWVAQGARLWPAEHNVYSYLPGYMEAAYLHVGAMTGGGSAGGGSFVAGSGLGVIACQMVHAMLGVLTALLVGRCVLVMARRWAPGAGAMVGACVAAATVIGLPWVMVTGSLAYNELGITAMLAGAVLVSLERGWSAASRGAAVGMLMGVACSIKPTALFLAAPMGGLFLLWGVRQGVRERLIAAGAGSITGLAAIVVWLWRNWAASGNPVFPFARRIFGNGHWTDEQYARYEPAHAFHGGVMDRLGVFFSTDRGILNEQWAILFPIGVLAIAGACVWNGTRRAGVLLAISLAGMIGAWLVLTHLQSRFLLPAVVPLALGVGLATLALIGWVGRRAGEAAGSGSGGVRALAVVVAALVPLSLTGWGWMVFLGQRAGHPNRIMAVGGVGLLTGAAYGAEIAQLPQSERVRALGEMAPTPLINYVLEPGQAVYMLGNAAPLYFIPAGGPRSVVYHTTWDASPLGNAVRAHPDDPAAWTAAVRATRSDRSVDYVLLDLDELNRLYPEDGQKPVWYDRAVTQRVVQQWLKDQGELVRAWPTSDRGGVFLFRLRGAGGGTR